MKPLQTLSTGLFLLLCTAYTAIAVDAVQDPDVSVNPVVFQFPITTLGTSSTPALFTISNKSVSAFSLGTRTLSGVNGIEFTLGASTCGAFLAAGGSCTQEVSFSPASKGTKSATLEIQTGSTTTPVLTAFLTNSTSATVEAQRRLPAVLSALAIPETMTAGQNYTLTWTIEGYDTTYTSIVALFDCTGISDGSCGNNYSDATKFAESVPLTQNVGTAGNWTYSGAATKQFTFNWDLNVPLTRPGGGVWAVSPGSAIVARIYQKTGIDAIRNNPYISLLLPGNQASAYYDKEGRRIVKYVAAP